MMTRNLRPALPAATHASTIAAPIWLCTGAWVFACRGDEELVLDIDKVFRLADDLAICVLYALLGKNAARPVGRATDDLRVHASLTALY